MLAARIADLESQAKEATAKQDLVGARRIYLQLDVFDTGRAKKGLAEVESLETEGKCNALAAEAKVAEKAGDWPVARAKWNKIIELRPSDAEARHALTEIGTYEKPAGSNL